MNIPKKSTQVVMTKTEAAFYARFEQLPADVKAEAMAAANEMMLFQAAEMAGSIDQKTPRSSLPK